MNVTQVASCLYVPYCVERDGPSQPIATALSLSTGKHLCQQHFLQRCRTMAQRLPSDERGEFPIHQLEKIHLEWSQSASGGYEGQPSGWNASPFALMTTTLYKLSPTE